MATDIIDMDIDIDLGDMDEDYTEEMGVETALPIVTVSNQADLHHTLSQY